MREGFNFVQYWDNAFSYIARARKPRAVFQDTKDLEWYKAEEQRMFGFDYEDFNYATSLIEYARNVSIECLKSIIIDLHKYNNCEYEIISASNVSFGTPIFLAIKEADNCLAFFKEMEESALWKIQEKEPKTIQECMKQANCSTCKYIYLMWDAAYLQVVGRNDDANDPGRGFNLFSIMYYMKSYFENEYDAFAEPIKNYVQKVEGLIGYSITKSLNPYALEDFRRLTQRKCALIDYIAIKDIVVIGKEDKEFRMPYEDLLIMRERYLHNETFLIAFGKNDFAESIMTAEWLFDSMKRAAAIDLTVIGLGYFKAVEQLLFDLISTRMGKANYQIKKNGSKGKIPFTREKLDNDEIDTTLGSMANFIKDYRDDLLIHDISFKAKKYIQESIYSYVRLRNGYFHKHNIHDIEVIKEIQKTTWNMFFLLLSSFDISTDDKRFLGLRLTVKTDYEKLCEYVDSHYGNVFIVEVDGHEVIAIGQKDELIKYDNERTIYSGVYFQALGTKDIFRFREKLPSKIYLGKFGYGSAPDNSFVMNPQKVALIFEENKFVGPKFADELMMKY